MTIKTPMTEEQISRLNLPNNGWGTQPIDIYYKKPIMKKIKKFWSWLLRELRETAANAPKYGW